MNSRHLLITIGCGLAIAGIACNQRVGVLETPAAVATPVGPSAPSPLPAPVSRPPNVASIAISSNAVSAGSSLRGTTTLSGPAPAPGVNVSLSVSDDIARVEPVVSVPEGSTSVDFMISTRGLQGERQVVITASTPDRSVTGAFKVLGEPPPVFFQFFSEPGNPIAQGAADRLTPGVESFEASCDGNLVFIYLLGPANENWTIRFSAPSGKPLRRGLYEGATEAPFNTSTPGIMVFGRARGCDSYGTFQVHDVDLQGNRVNRLHVSFEQRCQRFNGVLTGELRLINAPAVSIYPARSCLQ